MLTWSWLDANENIIYKIEFVGCTWFFIIGCQHYLKDTCVNLERRNYAISPQMSWSFQNTPDFYFCSFPKKKLQHSRSSPERNIQNYRLFVYLWYSISGITFRKGTSSILGSFLTKMCRMLGSLNLRKKWHPNKQA